MAGLTVCVCGLGYVGAPLAVEFGKIVKTIGYDINEERVEELNHGIDKTQMIEPVDLMLNTPNLFLTSDPQFIKQADYIIIAVPTPVREDKKPDFKYLESASATVGLFMKRGSIVIYESTVYPGATEEICIPKLESMKGFKWKKDFFCSYSPERINPNDPVHTLRTVTKIISGDTPETLKRVSNLYKLVCNNIYEVDTIQEAEASKVIENTQRDINIAFVNEISIILNSLGINTESVLKACRTKWNWNNFVPGLVGGSCISLDPYYLIERSLKKANFRPSFLIQARERNEMMADYAANRFLIEFYDAYKNFCDDPSVAVLGVTMKSDSPDTANSQVFKILNILEDEGIDPIINDPYYNDDYIHLDDIKDMCGIIIAVGHREYKELTNDDWKKMVVEGGIIFDVKSILHGRNIEGRKIVSL